MTHAHRHRIHPHDEDHGHALHGGGGHGHGHVGHHDGDRLWLPALASRRVHRIGRRGFLADLGRKTFAVAVLGAGVAACSSDSDVAAPTPTADPDPTATPATDASGDGDLAAPPDDVDPEVEADDPDVDAPAELRWSQVSLGFVSAYVLVRGSEAAVVDTGNPGSGADIASALGTLGVGWSAVRHVILTHAHGDHVGGLSDVLTEAPEANVYAGELDIGAILTPAPVQAVGDGDEVLGLEIIETPGHTPGHISVLDTGIGLLVAGDALNTDDAGSVVSGPNPSFTADMGTANESVAKLASREFETLAVGHGNPVESGADDLVVDLTLQN